MASPVWISHRGFKESAVENTREAFAAARSIGFRWLETDLRLTADNHIVLHHDPLMDRTAGRRTDISKSSRRDLEKLVLQGSSRLLFLDEFLQEFSDCNWVLDIKPESAERTIPLLRDMVKAMNLAPYLPARCRFVTWSRRHEEMIARFLPGVPCYARRGECWRAGLCCLAALPALSGIVPGRTYSVTPSVGPFQLFQPAVLERYRGAGARLLAFLPESGKQTAQAVSLGFDEILTNGRIQP